VILGAILGNTLNFYIGVWLGRKIYDGSIGWIDQGALRRTHDFYDRHGGKTIVIARFVPVVRSFAPLVAGAAGMPVARFQLFSITGAVLWIVSLVGGGYLFGNIPVIRDNLSMILILGILAALGPISLAAGLRWWKLRRAARA
jgi:membrane-associated protein